MSRTAWGKYLPQDDAMEKNAYPRKVYTLKNNGYDTIKKTCKKNDFILLYGFERHTL